MFLSHQSWRASNSMGHMKTGEAMVNVTLPESTSELSEVLGETSKLLFHKKLVAFLIFLISLLPISFLHVCHLIFSLLKEELHAADDDESSTFIKVFIIVLGWMLAFLLVFGITFVFGAIITVHHTIYTYMRKSISLRDLFLKTATSWKRLVIGWPSLFINTVYILLVLFLMLGLKIVSFSNGMTKWVGLIEFAIAIYESYHIVVCTVGYVVSVTEECDDIIKALERARHLIGERKVHVRLMLFLLLTYAPICLLLHLHFSYDDRAEILRYVMGCLVTTVLFGIAQLYTFALFTVFYCESKKHHGEKEVKIASEE